eukprot:10668081-Alexandrium_andersonii.AAC.1
MPAIVLRPDVCLHAAARSVPPCLTLRCHAKKVRPDNDQCATHNGCNCKAIPSVSPTFCAPCP